MNNRGAHRTRWIQRGGVLLLTGLLACGKSHHSGTPKPGTLEVHGSVGQFFVIGASSQTPVTLLDAKGETVQSGTTDALGGFIFRNVPPGDGYSAMGTLSDGSQGEGGPVTVLAEDYVPDPGFYSRQLLPTGPYGAAGFGYITTRDGTQLSAQVNIPSSGSGPFPVLVEYSGYGPSDPTPDNLATGSINAFREIASLFNYAYVGVNIRGTGCSGGAFDYFEKLQSLDGYDAIETIAAQPWAAKVAMVGISYSGISQLFVAQTQPPHLAAITPFSVIDDTFRGTLYPGGIFNNGFALHWAMQRQTQNQWPNPVGADWVVKRISQGDQQCFQNQLLRQQNPDLLKKIERNPFYPAPGNPDYPEGGDILAPFSFVNRINVPVYIAGAWQDDETGGHWPVMLEQFSPSTHLRVAAYNGTHVDALGPEKLGRLIEFLEFNVALRVPSIPPSVRVLAPILYQGIFGADGVQLPPDRFAGMSYPDAFQSFQSENPIHVYWENGAKLGTTTLGSPEAAAESSYPQWPPPTTATRWYFQPGGKLGPQAPSIADSDAQASDSYAYDPDAKPRSDFQCPNGNPDPSSCSGDVWKAGAVYDWQQLPGGKALSYISDPLTQNLTMLGSGSVDLWVTSTATDTDVEVTLTEVRTDGQERYVQNGELRLSHRKIDPATSTELRPRQTHLATDASPLQPGQFVLARVELFPFGHVFRAGSRVRISIETPGGNRPLWAFDVLRNGTGIANSIGHSINRASSVVLPVVADVAVPTALPPCPISLRGQPCRPFP